MDRTTKLLLAAIALGLWVNIAAPLLRPTSVKAQVPYEQAQVPFEQSVQNIAQSISMIAYGNCPNRVLCH